MIGAIADGNAAQNQIANAAHLTTSELAYYLAELMRMGIVGREEPVVGRSRSPIYALNDNLLRFWYKFVYPRKTMIELGMGERAASAAMDGLTGYMGPIFEQMCAQWLWCQNAHGTSPVLFDRLGRWWGNDPSERSQAEIDLVATEGPNVVLVGECTWRNEKLLESVFKTLDHQVGLVHADAAAVWCAFLKSGFTEGAGAYAGTSGAFKLIGFDDMLS